MDSIEVLPLITRAKDRDQEAFAQLYDLYATRLYRFISYKIPTREQAEDVLQETFFKAWQALPKLSLEKLNFSAWLYKIARNLINDQYRSLKRRPTPDTIENHFDLASKDDTMEETAQAMQVEELRSAIDELPANYRQVLELRFIQQYSIEETASALGKTAIAIRVAQHRAIKKLSNFLSDYRNENA